MKRPRRRTSTDATPTEWAWLTAAPDANPFIGLVGDVLDPRLVEHPGRSRVRRMRRLSARDKAELVGDAQVYVGALLLAIGAGIAWLPAGPMVFGLFLTWLGLFWGKR